MKNTIKCLLLCSMLSLPICAQAEGVDPEAALQMLIEGNARFVKMSPQHPDQSTERRAVVAKGQTPFAIILSCSDSRVPPELIFDQGLGDLFVVRLAGNIVDNSALGSIEYAAEHLGARLILVLGHERCGAVTAAVNGGKLPGHIAEIVQNIMPAVETHRGADGKADVETCITENVNRVVKELKGAKPIISELVEAGKLAVFGAKYDLDSGTVDFYRN